MGLVSVYGILTLYGILHVVCRACQPQPNQREYMTEFIAATPGIVDFIKECVFFSIFVVIIVQGFLAIESYQSLMDAIKSLEQSLSVLNKNIGEPKDRAQKQETTCLCSCHPKEHQLPAV